MSAGINVSADFYGITIVFPVHNYINKKYKRENCGRKKT